MTQKEKQTVSYAYSYILNSNSDYGNDTFSTG